MNTQSKSITSSTALERLKRAARFAGGIVQDGVLQCVSNADDLEAALAVIEASVLYRAAVQRDNADGHYKAHLGERYLEFVHALDRLTLTTADQGEKM